METTTDPITSDAVAKRRPLTVLQVIPALETGGAERGAVDVAAALTAAGWRAVVASSGGPMEHELERVGARHVTLPLARKNPFAIRANIDRLAMLIEVAGVDLVHARSRAPAWSALYAARRTGRPFVTTFHSPYSSSNRLKSWYNSVMARGDRVIAISHFVGTHVGENYRVKDQSLRIVPRGIDLAVFDAAQVSAGRLVALAEACRSQATASRCPRFRADQSHPCRSGSTLARPGGSDPGRGRSAEAPSRPVFKRGAQRKAGGPAGGNSPTRFRPPVQLLSAL